MNEPQKPIQIPRTDIDWEWDAKNREYVVRAYLDGTATVLAEVRYPLDKFQRLASDMLNNTTYRVEDMEREREATEKFVIGQVGSDTVLGVVFTSKELAELYRGRNGLLAGWEIRKLTQPLG